MKSFRLICSLFATFSFLGLSPTHADSSVLAGFAIEDITPEMGVPLGGYGGGGRRIIPFDLFNRYPHCRYLKPSTGILDPVRIKVMVLRNGDQKLAFVSADTVGIITHFLDDLLAELGEEWNRNEIFVSATHTHSGPGGLSKKLIWQLIAMDKFLPEVYGDTVHSVAEGIRKAYLDAEPVDLLATQFKVEGLQANRREDHAPAHFDPDSHLLIARTQGENPRYLGAMVGLAIHGTSLSSRNYEFSADVPGSIEHSFGRTLAKMNGSSGSEDEVPVLFVNGAEGDVKPVEEGIEHMYWIGQEYARQAEVAMGSLRVIDPTWKVRTTPVNIGSAKLALRGCMPTGFIQKLIWKKLRLNVSWMLPKQTQIWMIDLGNIRMLTWPGEPTTHLGLELRSMAKSEEFPQTWVLGLTNDYTSYYTTQEEYDFGGYETCSSLFGPLGGKRILAAYQDLLRHKVSAAEPAVEPVDSNE